MSTLYIDRKNLRLAIDGEALIFYQDGLRTTTLPLNIIDRICIRGDLTLSANVLGKLGEHDIGVLVFDGRNHRVTLLMPCARKDAARRVIQAHYSTDPAFCAAFAQELVKEKIRGDLALLQKQQEQPHIAQNRLHHPIAQLERTLDQLARPIADTATLRGIEGQAAAAAFNGIASVLPASLNFRERNRNPPRDPYNVALSLGYTLLHHDMVRQIHLTGLDPYIGYYHNLTHGRESLACDLIEPLRPLVTAWAIELFHDHTLRPEDFTMRGEACNMGKAARGRYYPAYENRAKEWRKAMREQCLNLLHTLATAADKQPEMRQYVAAFNEEDNLTTI